MQRVAGDEVVFGSGLVIGPVSHGGSCVSIAAQGQAWSWSIGNGRTFAFRRG
jgi:hypothetical protein